MKELSDTDINKLLYAINGLLCWQYMVNSKVSNPNSCPESTAAVMSWFNSEIDKIESILGRTSPLNKYIAFSTGEPYNEKV